MKENADKSLDNLTRKLVGKASLEQPSLDFTQRVMSEILALKKSKVTTYVPLISKRVWVFIAIGVSTIVAYVAFGTAEMDSSWMTRLGLEHYADYSVKNPMEEVKLSQTLIYTLVLFALMICIQVPLLKRYFDNRLDT